MSDGRADAIGRVRFDIEGEREAILHSDRSWAIEPGFDGVRQAIFLAHLDDLSASYAGPQDGFFGVRQLREAAAYFKGEVVEGPEVPDGASGTVY